MQKRSTDSLPSFFVHQNTFPYATDRKPHIYALEIYDFTFLHFHDFLEIGFCVDGEGICRIEDAEYEFKKGDIQIIFPFQNHLSKNKTDESSRWCWLNINPYALMETTGFATISKIEHLMFHEMALCGIFSPEKYPEIVELANCLLRETLKNSMETPHHLELCASYLYQILIHLARISQEFPKLQMKRDKHVSALTPALNMITSGIQNSSIPSVHELADVCGMSVSNFRKVWTKVIGLSPKDYITKSFLYKAQQLLITTDKAITEIAMETGFSNISGFNRHFLSKCHMSPSDFRKRYKNELPSL